jgi:hypothetical protein
LGVITFIAFLLTRFLFCLGWVSYVIPPYPFPPYAFMFLTYNFLKQQTDTRLARR